MCIDDYVAPDESHYDGDHYHDGTRDDVGYITMDGKRGQLSHGTTLFPDGDSLAVGFLVVLIPIMFERVMYIHRVAGRILA